jgi:hypothetical protein
MLKKEEIADPRSCWNKCPDDKLVFVLIEDDPLFTELVMWWANLRCQRGHNYGSDAKILSAIDIACWANDRKG